jgi:hypothetical protein
MGTRPGLRLGMGLAPEELLHAVVLGVGDVQIPMGIQGDAPRVAELAGLAASTPQDFQRLVVRVKNLHPAVAEFANKLSSLPVHANVIRVTQLAGAFAGPAVGAQPFSFRTEHLDAVVAGVGDIEAVLEVQAQALGPAEFAVRGAGLAEAAQQRLAIG